MKECITELRAGWYGDANYWQWVYAGKPTMDGDGGASGEQLTAEEMIAATMKRKGKQRKPKAGLDLRKDLVTAANWVPADCHPPANCRGLIEKVKGEANEMIRNIGGLSGTITNLTVDDDAKLVDQDTRNMSDMTGVNCVELLGNDVVLDLTGTVQTISTDTDTHTEQTAARITRSRCPAL